MGWESNVVPLCSGVRLRADNEIPGFESSTSIEKKVVALASSALLTKTVMTQCKLIKESNNHECALDTKV